METELNFDDLERDMASLEALTSLRGVLAKKKEKGEPMSSAALETLNAMTSSMIKRDPWARESNDSFSLTMPSLESFERSPVDSLNYAMEEIMSGIKKVWDSIVDFFVRMFKAIRSWFKDINNTDKKNLKELNKLKSDISKYTKQDSFGLDESLDLSKYINQYGFSSKTVLVNSNDLVAELHTVMGNMLRMIENYNSVTFVLKEIIDVINFKEKKGISNEDMFKQLKELNEKLFYDITRGLEVVNSVEPKSYGRFPKGYVLKKDSANFNLKTLEFVSLEVLHVSSWKNGNFKPGETSTLIDANINIIQRRLETDDSEIEDLLKKLINTMKNVENLDNVSKDGTLDSIKNVQKIVRSLNTTLPMLVQTHTEVVTGICNDLKNAAS